MIFYCMVWYAATSGKIFWYLLAWYDMLWYQVRYYDVLLYDMLQCHWGCCVVVWHTITLVWLCSSFAKSVAANIGNSLLLFVKSSLVNVLYHRHILILLLFSCIELKWNVLFLWYQPIIISPDEVDGSLLIHPSKVPPLCALCLHSNVLCFHFLTCRPWEVMKAMKHRSAFSSFSCWFWNPTNSGAEWWTLSKITLQSTGSSLTGTHSIWHITR